MVLSGKHTYSWYDDYDDRYYKEETKWDGKQTCEMYGGDIECRGNPKASDFNTLWFKFGGGLDYDLSETMFLRSSLLYGIRLSNKIEKDWEDGGDTRLGHGLDIRVGVGFRL